MQQLTTNPSGSTAIDRLFRPASTNPASTNPASTNPAAAAATIVLRHSSRSADPVDSALRAAAPHLTIADRTGWVAVLAAPLQRAAINTPRRIAAFLGQCAVESGGFRTLEEDLTYSATRLCQVWPNRFPTQATAEACAFNAQALANQVYANRLGNGAPETGDGWLFRGRGLIQITGRTAYERFAAAMNMTLDQAVDHAASHAGAADSAAWYWLANDLNKFADAWMLDKLTKAINGGTLGAAERSRLSQAALNAIGV